MSRRLRLLIAEREATRVGIRMALNGDAEICAEVDDAEQAIRAAMREQPDLCLVGDDLRGSGLAAVRGICRAAPATAVVVLSQSQDVDVLLDYVRAGAVGYIPTALDADRLRRIVHAVAANEAAIPRSIGRSISPPSHRSSRWCITATDFAPRRTSANITMPSTTCSR